MRYVSDELSARLYHLGQQMQELMEQKRVGPWTEGHQAEWDRVKEQLKVIDELLEQDII